MFGYRIDACAEHILAGILQEAGVAHLADNLFVYLAGLRFAQNFPGSPLAVNIYREVGNRGIFRYGKHVNSFHVPVVRVLEYLVDRDCGDIILDDNVCPMIFY